jgi:hypothetical protein
LLLCILLFIQLNNILLKLFHRLSELDDTTKAPSAGIAKVGFPMRPARFTVFYPLSSGLLSKEPELKERINFV